MADIAGPVIPLIRYRGVVVIMSHTHKEMHRSRSGKTISCMYMSLPMIRECPADDRRRVSSLESQM